MGRGTQAAVVIATMAAVAMAVRIDAQSASTALRQAAYIKASNPHMGDHFGNGGKSAALPSTAPSATHAWIKPISSSRKRLSSLNSPYPGSNNQGGMARSRVTWAISLARFLTSA